MSTAPAPTAALPPHLLAGYTPLPGVADELVDAQGQLRPVWQGFLDQLLQLPPEDVAQRFARGEQYLRDAGVYFRLYSGGPVQERDWPLSHVPVLIPDGEWHEVCAGLAQRADLLEQIVADLYGPGNLVAQGHLPAELVAENPHWLRPLVGVKPHSGHWLHHIAFEIGRSPDGSFLVLGDRTQAPSGAGFALETRMATSRIFTDPFQRGNVYRLAGFFRAFRDSMERLSGEGRRAAILTPGPNNDTYYEHAYIARYLGLSLLEGENLLVRDGQVMVRTVRGLEPLGLLWRRIDGDFVDPLELDETSQLGTPGLIDALRQGSVTMINAPGSGVLETRAFMAFFPRIAQALMGERLRLPNIATWWCGQPFEADYVRQNAARMLIGGALDTDLPFARDGDTAPALELATLDQRITVAGRHLVGQEAVTLSTTPAWHDGKLSPRPMTIRVFAARTETGWTFMPGGYARIGRSGDARALAMQAGGSVADVWVMADAPMPPETLVAPAIFTRVTESSLPARAADNLYWLGRYVERTEAMLRLLRAWHLRQAETGQAGEAQLAPLAAYLASLGMTLEKPLPDSLHKLIGAAQGAAAKVRDRFSPDGWTALGDLARSAVMLSDKVSAGDDAARALSVLLRKLSGFSGLVHENMYHSTGWRFLSVGRAEERADATLMFLRAFTTPEAGPGALELAVELGDSVLTHQNRYRFGPSRESVLDLLLLDARNPRAVLYQVSQLRHHASRLPGGTQDGALSTGLPDLERRLLMIDTELRVSFPEAVTDAQIEGLRGQLGGVLDVLSHQYFR